MTLVDLTRQIISSEVDDYFDDDTIVFHLNNCVDDIISLALRQEFTSNRGIRALDDLRASQAVTITSPTAYGSVFTKSENKPSDFYEVLFVELGKVQSVHVNKSSLNKILTGILVPTSNEYYHTIGNETFTFYLPTNVSVSGSIDYIKEPPSILKVATELPSLPKRLKTAVVYGAAVKLLMQEKYTENVQPFQATYNSQLQINLW